MQNLINKKGFTVVEILVVLTAMAILAVVGLANFANFGQDQTLGSAVSDVQNFLRLAQSNAQSGVKCTGSGDASWLVEFSQVSLDLKCQIATATPSASLKKLSLSDTQVESIVGSCLPTLPVTVTFSPLFGTVKFSDQAANPCFSDSPSLNIAIKNTKTNSIKTFIISKGGGIDL